MNKKQRNVFDSVPYGRSKKSSRGGGVLIFIKKNLSYKIRKDFSESDEHKEILSLEISYKNSSNILLSSCYKPPKGDNDILSMFLKQVFRKTAAEKKAYYLAENLNINCLEYFENEKVSTFYNSLFEYGASALINKPTRVAKTSATIIDNVITANIFDESLEKGIIKSDLSDHLPIFFSTSTSKSPQNFSPLKLKKRIFNENNLASFKDQISNINWDNLNSTQCSVNSLYKIFLNIFDGMYDINIFPLTEIKIKPKNLKMSWFSKGLKKSSKTKQRLYIKFLKNKSAESDKRYKNYKNLFEKFKTKSRKNYYDPLLNKYKFDTKRRWQVMKEITGKQKTKSSSLPKTIKRKQGITEKEIAREFNKYFTSVGTVLAREIPIVIKDVSEYLPQCNASMEHKELSFQEFEKAYKALKRNKAIGCDGLNGNIIIDVYDSMKVILLKNFKVSLEEAAFPEKLKIAKVIPVFKKGDKENVENYQLISILSVFSKVLERIVYNRLYEYLMNNNLLHKNQFGFQISNSTDHAILQFTCDIAQHFDNGKFTLGVFIDLSKTFDTVNHQILLKKLKRYGVNEKTLARLQRNLFQRKQYIENTNGIKYLPETDCGVPQGSILGPLLFLIYENDFYLASRLKNAMFADDTNLFISDENIGELFQQMNKEQKSAFI